MSWSLWSLSDQSTTLPSVRWPGVQSGSEPVSIDNQDQNLYQYTFSIRTCINRHSGSEPVSIVAISAWQRFFESSRRGNKLIGTRFRCNVRFGPSLSYIRRAYTGMPWLDCFRTVYSLPYHLSAILCLPFQATTLTRTRSPGWTTAPRTRLS